MIEYDCFSKADERRLVVDLSDEWTFAMKRVFDLKLADVACANMDIKMIDFSGRKRSIDARVLSK